MSEFLKTYVGRDLDSLTSAAKQRPYSRVTVIAGEDLRYTAGDDTGETLIVRSPWGTQAVADNLLRRYRGFQYQAYEAEGAALDPAAELGDGITVGRVYGGLYRETLHFDRIPRSDIGAPQREQAGHEYHHVPHTDRVVQRQMNSLRSTLKVQAGLIEARVEASGGNTQSFGWKLEKDHHSWYADGVEIIRFSREEAYFHGTVRAGKIVAGGINGTFDGSGITGGTITNSEIAGNTITNYEVQGGTLTTGCMSYGINTSLGYANFASGVFSGTETADYLDGNHCSLRDVAIGGYTFTFSGLTVSWQTRKIGGVSITYLGQ